MGYPGGQRDKPTEKICWYRHLLSYPSPQNHALTEDQINILEDHSYSSTLTSIFVLSVDFHNHTALKFYEWWIEIGALFGMLLFVAPANSCSTFSFSNFKFSKSTWQLPTDRWDALEEGFDLVRDAQMAGRVQQHYLVLRLSRAFSYVQLSIAIACLLWPFLSRISFRSCIQHPD